MNGVGKQFFTGPTFSGNENRRAGLGDLFGHGFEPRHFAALAYNHIKAVLGAEYTFYSIPIKSQFFFQVSYFFGQGLGIPKVQKQALAYSSYEVAFLVTCYIWGTW